MKQELSDFLEHWGKKLEADLVHWLPRSAQPCMERLNKAIHYAVFSGGKRMRPFFTLLAVKTVGGDPQRAMPLACAIEYLHTSSLIFDDLPSMDNAFLRRGQKSLHLVYGEGLAILAALALFNQTYALIGQMGIQIEEREKILRLIGEVTHCIGPDGMIGGQSLDLQVRGQADSARRPIQYLKTTALMRLMFSAGAIVTGAKDSEINVLVQVGEELGLAYQIMDDFMDRSEDVRDRVMNQPRSTDASPELQDEDFWREALECLARARNYLLDHFPSGQAALLIEYADMIFETLQHECQIVRLAREKSHIRMKK